MKKKRNKYRCGQRTVRLAVVESSATGISSKARSLRAQTQVIKTKTETLTIEKEQRKIELCSKRALSTNGEARRRWSYVPPKTRPLIVISLPTLHDPKHTAEIVKLWLLYNVTNQLHTPTQSPDLNPVGYLWDLRERKIRKYNVSSKDMLKSVLKDEWEKISAEEKTKLVNSMSERLQEVLERRGYPTSY
ncbi:transposable element Tcb1 transposase [Trichonephila clavipes]|nr:transposable element Tcb1 transposase [Trichonephila clavipes]